MRQAVIYDMDGIIIDSEPLWRQAMIRGFGTVNLKLTEQDCRKTTGMRIQEVILHWYAISPWKGKTPSEVEDTIINNLCQLIQSEGKAMYGLLDSMEFFKKENYNLGLATSSSNKLLDTVLDTLKIRNEFQHLQSAELLLYGKPHPEVYLRCAEELKVLPQNCIAVEDSVNGVISGKAAGMKVIAVPDSENLNDPRFSIADVKIHSLKEIGNSILEKLKN